MSARAQESGGGGGDGGGDDGGGDDGGGGGGDDGGGGGGGRSPVPRPPPPPHAETSRAAASRVGTRHSAAAPVARESRGRWNSGKRFTSPPIRPSPCPVGTSSRLGLSPRFWSCSVFADGSSPGIQSAFLRGSRAAGRDRPVRTPLTSGVSERSGSSWGLASHRRTGFAPASGADGIEPPRACLNPARQQSSGPSATLSTMPLDSLIRAEGGPD